MLGLRKRERRHPAGDRIDADLSGAVVHGPVAIGEHIVQIVAEHGAIVNYAAPEQRPVPRLRPVPVRRLPRDFPGLLGRKSETRTARESLVAGGPLEVGGPDGIGKSALLRHLAHRLDASEDASLIHAGCAGRPADDVLQLLFEALYECDQVFVPSPAQLAEYLQGPRATFLLDDLEASRQDAERILDLAPACTFVLASGSRLVFGEGTSLALSPLEGDAALALFQRGLGRELEASERDGAAAFCRAEGRPLRVLQAADLVRRGIATAQNLAGADPAVLIAETLGEEDRAVLAPLAAVRAALPEERVGAVADVPDAAAVLDGLEQRGLVQAHSRSWSLRESAPTAALAGAAEARERTIDKLADWAEAQPEPAAVAAAAGALIAGIDAAAAAGEHGSALRLARAADAGLAASGRWGAWGQVLERALRAARALQDRPAEAWSLHQLGSRALPRGERELAASSLAAALELRETLGDSDGAAVTRHNLDVLRGGGPPGRTARPPKGPRRPPLWLLLALGAAGIAAAVFALSQGGSEQASQPAGGATSTGADTSTRGQTSPAGDGGRTSPAKVPASIRDQLDFKAAAVNGGESTGTVTAKNEGKAPIQLGRVALSSTEDFSISKDGCGGQQLAPGASCEVALEFSPRARPASDRRAVPLSQAAPSSGTSDTVGAPTDSATPTDSVPSEPPPPQRDIRTATLTFSDTGTGQPHNVKLSGEATRADVR